MGGIPHDERFPNSHAHLRFSDLGGTMESLTYTFRRSLVSKLETLSLSDSGLAVEGHPPVAFADIGRIRTYQSPGLTTVGYGQMAPVSNRCTVWPKSGGTIALWSTSLIGAGKFEDRSASYDPFVAALIRETGKANPAAIFVSGMPMGLWLGWIVVIALASLIALFMTLILVFMARDKNPPWGGIFLTGVFVLGIVWGIHSLARVVTRSRPRHYDPRSATP